MKQLIVLAIAWSVYSSTNSESSGVQDDRSSHQSGESEKVSAKELHRTGKHEIHADGVAGQVLVQVSADLANKNVPLPDQPYVVEDPSQPLVYVIDVPDNYTKDEAFGLVVWISSYKYGRFPKQYGDVLKTRRLISIGANNSGNNNATIFRAGYAIQAVELMKQRYNIDMDRIYLSGSSGGGRVASITMMLYPDIFSGGFPMIGADPVLTVDAVGKPGQRYEGLKWIPKQRFADAAKFGRYAFLTGENDHNRAAILSTSQGYVKHGFQHVDYIEEPGLGHKAVSPETVDKAIQFLDHPLPVIAANQFQQAKKLRRTKPGQAMVLLKSAIRHAAGADWLDDANTELQKLESSHEKAFEKLVDTLTKKPNTSARNIVRFEKKWEPLKADQHERLSKIINK